MGNSGIGVPLPELAAYCRGSGRGSRAFKE